MMNEALTIELSSQERIALENLSEIEGRPVKDLFHEAVTSYLGRRKDTSVSLEGTLERLRAYHKQDPDYAMARAAFVDAEASLEDPLEGAVLDDRTVAEPIQIFE